MNLKVTLLHEFAHILTLQKDQLDMNKDVLYVEEDDPVHRLAEEACDYYFVSGMGCTQETSYLNQFYEQFWTDIIKEWQERGVEGDLEAMEQFFWDYEDRFATDYAAMNPVEDIAE